MHFHADDMRTQKDKISDRFIAYYKMPPACRIQYPWFIVFIGRGQLLIIIPVFIKEFLC